MNSSAMKGVLRSKQDDRNDAVRLLANPWENPEFDAPVRSGSNSRFQDDTWQQPVTVLTQHRAELRIKFDQALGTGERLTDPHLRDLLWACKCYVWSLIHAGGHGKGAPSTVRQHWDDLLSLVKWMRQHSYGAFGELDDDAILDYVCHVKQLQAAPRVKAERLRSLRDLYFHQDRLPEGFRLLAHPFGGDGDPERFYKARRQNLQSIPFIPDEVIIPVVMEARRWLEEYAVDVIRLTEQAEGVGATYGAPEYKSKCKKRAAAMRSFRPSGGNAGDWYTSPLTNVFDLYCLQQRMHAAAIIVVGCFAGPRLHEILSLEPGCIRGPVVSEDGTLEIFYIQGTTVKISPKTFGHAREWVAGARPAGTEERMVVVDAVRTLEALHRAARISYAKLIFSPGERDTGYTFCTLSRLLVDFFALVPAAKQWRVSSHQFRKTFARFVSRYDTRYNAALSQQLGHVRLAMTDAYVAKDLDLVRLLEREHAELISEGFMALLRAEEMAGKKGEEIVRSVARLRAKIADEAEFIAICGRLGRDANIVLHLGEHGACYFRQSTALCGGVKAPNLAVRTPSMCVECQNLVVTEEHRPFWERRVQDNQRLLESYPDALPALRDKWSSSLAQATHLLAKLAESREILSNEQA